MKTISSINLNPINPSVNENNIYGNWFMNTLGYSEREKIRKFYRLNIRCLKITNDMIKDIYEIELNKPPYNRLISDRFFSISLN